MIVLRADPARRIAAGTRPKGGRGSWVVFAMAVGASATLHAAVLIALAGRGESAAPPFETLDIVAVQGIDPPQPAIAWTALGAPPSAPMVQSMTSAPAPRMAMEPPGGFVAVASAAAPPAIPPTIVPPTMSYPGVTTPAAPPPSVAPPRTAPPAPLPVPAAPPAIAPVPAARPPGQTGAAPSLPSIAPLANPPPVTPPAAVAPPVPPAAVPPPPRKAPAQRSHGTPGPTPVQLASSDPSGETADRREPRVVASLPGAGASPRGDGADLAASPMSGNPPPVYPVAARRAHREGRVVLRVVVSGDGGGRDIRIAESSGTPSLDDAAVQAVRGWRFTPAMRSGSVTEDVILVPVVFRLSP